MIRGTETRLHALQHDDLPRFVQRINDPEMRAVVAIRYPLSLTEELEWRERFLQRQNEYIFAMEEDGHFHDELVIAILRQGFLDSQGDMA